MRTMTSVLLFLVGSACSSTGDGDGTSGGGGDTATTATGSGAGTTGGGGETGTGGSGGTGGTGGTAVTTVSSTGTGGSGASAGGGGEGGRREPTGEECLAITNREDCEAAGCLLGWRGVQLVGLVDDQCTHDEEGVGRCLHATSLESPGAGMSTWWRETESGVEVFLMSSYCDVLGIQPCLGSPDVAYPGEPEDCGCAIGDQMCPPFPDGSE